ncbi:Tryptophan synthase alpha chain [Labilithrix luteola]|uniref:Tryptophan synthase alpha chain n=1 Tax=Labilithrix luteola TaxID=1391654 RepID=A0A0K1QF93_9BACT|nr:hypothetical protein [Labilithrix luteola]AKV04317.1 Tryptophan synthase alpha chain [Labilithrix luteola]
MNHRTSKPLLSSIVALSLTIGLGLVSCTRHERELGDALSKGDGGGPLFSDDGGKLEPDANTFTPLCKSRDCPVPYATCSSDTFECETNFDIDNANCGSCGIKCPQGQAIIDALHAEWFCQSGKCQMQCFARDGFLDCNNDVADGCESNLCDESNCGGCGIKCPAGVACIKGNCGCPPGFTACGNCETGRCVDLKTNDEHCGACDRACLPVDAPPYPHTYVGCGDAECATVKCDWGWDDCNNDLRKDGCEIETFSDPLNCGACGRKCAPGQTCFNGKCECKPAETLCQTQEDGQVYCADLSTDIFNCGACSHRCPNNPPRVLGVCNVGRCELKCPSGYADCDGRSENGCETHVAADPQNCGGCGTQCDIAFGQPCVGGVCLMAPCNSGGAQ